MKLNNGDIKTILNTIRMDWDKVSEADITFCVLLDKYADRTTAYKAAYGKQPKDVDAFLQTAHMRKLRRALENYGIGDVKVEDITLEENKSALLRMLDQVQDCIDEGTMDVKDGMKLKADIRFKLQDKFEIEESHKQRRIIVVPQKHDIICPHTNRECSKMPTKEACMKYYKLTPITNKSDENEERDSE